MQTSKFNNYLTDKEKESLKTSAKHYVETSKKHK